MKGLLTSGCAALMAFAAFVSPARDETVDVRLVGPGGGGYLVCLCASRHHRDRLYVGCDVGGFYRSDDRGRNYTILNAGIENPFVYCIAEHPTEPETLLIGTKGGVYRSTDGGLHWTSCRSGAKGIGPAEMYRCTWSVSQIAWCERNPSRAWAVACASKEAWMTEVWRTDDAGLTWERVNGPDDPLAGEKTRALSLTANPAVPDELLATTAGGLFLSEDAGAHWKRIVQGLPDDGVMDFGCVGRCMSNPNVAYLSMREKPGKEGWTHPCVSAVFRSEDGGRSWTRRAVPPVRPNAGKSPCPYWNEPVMTVDPVNPDVVWTGGSTFFRESVWRTSDGAMTWEQAFKGPVKGWIDFWGNGAARPVTVSLKDPAFVAYGTSGTIYATEDGGASWRQRYTRNDDKSAPMSGTGLEVTCVRFALADRERANRWYLGYWDVGLLISDDNGRTMRRCVSGIPIPRVNSCFAMVQSPDDGNVLWATFGDWAGRNPGSVFAVSRDRGENWSVMTNGWKGGISDALAFVKRGKDVVLAAATRRNWSDPKSPCGLQLSGDGGATWRDVSTNDFPLVDEITYVTAHEGVFYAGTNRKRGEFEGAVWSSADAGRTWRRLTPVDLVMAAPHQIAFRGDAIAVAADDPHRAKDGGGCFVSRDRGRTWRKTYEAPRCQGVAFVGDTLAISMPPVGWRDPGFCGDGIRLSRDLGETWTHAVGTGVDKPFSNRLAVNPFAPRELWCATGGNSVLVLGIGGKPETK